MTYLDYLAFSVGFYVLLAVSLSFPANLAGMMVVCQAAFCAIGAYTAGLLVPSLTHDGGWVLAASIPLGGIVGAGAGLLISRMRSEEVVLATLGVQMIASSLLLNSSITQGPMGIPKVVASSWLGFETQSDLIPTLVCVAMAGGAMALSVVGRRSRWTLSLHAMHDDPVLVETMGHSATSLKIQVMALSGAVAAAAGTLYALKITYIGPSAFTVTESIMLLTLVLLAGKYSTTGSAITATLFVLLPEALRFVGFESYVIAHVRQIVFGACLGVYVAARSRNARSHMVL